MPTWMIQFLIAATLCATALPARAVDEDDEFPGPTYELTAEEINGWIFGGADMVQARRNYEKSLRSKIKALTEIAPISPDQQRKLELAGLGDIALFLEEGEQLRREMPLGSVHLNTARILCRQCIAFRTRPNGGLHEAGSLYEKAVLTSLGPEEVKRIAAVIALRKRWKRQPTPGGDTVLNAVRGWGEQAAGIRKLEMRFDLVQCDAFEGVETRWHGRWMFEQPGNARLDLRPRSIPSDERSDYKKQNGQPYELKPGRLESWIRNEDAVIHLTANAFETFDLRPAVAEPLPIEEPDDDPHDERFAFPLPQTTSCRELTERFDWFLVSEFANTVRLQGTPRLPVDRNRVTAITVTLRRDSWRPESLEILDRGGTRESIYTFRDMRVNQRWRVESSIDPFRPDLSDYSRAQSSR